MSFSNNLTWTGFDTRGSEVVLSIRIGNELVKVGVVAHKTWARVLAHPIVKEVPTCLQHKQQSFSTLGP